MSRTQTAHPSTSVYLIVAVLLTLLTSMEVTVFYLRAVRPVLLPVLLLLSGAKFALVVMFYMHLRFDRWAYGAVFLFQLLIAAMVVVSLSVLFAAFPIGS
jgi:cytochrome c oxidase subunit 4